MSPGQLRDFPRPPTVGDVRAAANLALAAGDDESLFIAGWRVIEDSGQALQVIAAQGALLNWIAKTCTGPDEDLFLGFEVPAGPSAEHMLRAVAYIPELISGQRGLQSIPPRDWALLATALAKIIIAGGPDIAASLRVRLADPDWPRWNMADAASTWYNVAGRLS